MFLSIVHPKRASQDIAYSWCPEDMQRCQTAQSVVSLLVVTVLPYSAYSPARQSRSQIHRNSKTEWSKATTPFGEVKGKERLTLLSRDTRVYPHNVEVWSWSSPFLVEHHVAAQPWGYCDTINETKKWRHHPVPDSHTGSTEMADACSEVPILWCVFSWMQEVPALGI